MNEKIKRIKGEKTRQQKNAGKSRFEKWDKNVKERAEKVLDNLDEADKKRRERVEEYKDKHILDGIKYCPLCERNIKPTKKFWWGGFVGGLVVFSPLLYFSAFLYISLATYYPVNYFGYKHRNVCPICGCDKLQSPVTIESSKKDGRLDEK